jgi:NHLM bacteriocin system ABC transporter peptidase/ATP-binding protein
VIGVRATRRVRTPTRLQMEASECGAAALAIVLEHFGSYLPLARLRHECGVSRDGSKASNVVRAARGYGCDARGFRKEPHELAELPLPLIAHWNFNHFLVVEGFGKRHVFLNDPSSGPYAVTQQEFDRAFTGVVLVIQPGARFVPCGPRPQLLPQLLARVSGSARTFAFVVLAGLALALPGMLIPVFAKIFVDDILLGGKVNWLRGLFVAMALTALLRALLTALQRAQLIELIAKLGVSMSARFLWHALRLPIGFFQARSAGDLVGRVLLNDAVAGTLAAQLARGVLDLLLVGFYAALMLYYDVRLTLIGFGTAAAHVALLRFADRTRSDLSRRLAQQHGKLAGVAASGLQMIETIKATGSESSFFAQWAGHQAKLVGSQQSLLRREQWLSAGVAALSRTNALLVLGFGALGVMDGHLTIGGLVAFESLMASFIAPIEGLSRLAAALQQLRGNVERLDDVQTHTTGLPAESDSDPPGHALSGALSLHGVSFGYSPCEPPLLRELDLALAPGQRVALVGGTGSGKSTIAKLVCGLYAPSAGQICFDGRPREELPRSQLTAAVALVDQEICLFEGSVRDNIALWDDTLAEAEIVRAAKDACIHDDITRLPGGYSARLGEGGFNLSGGQRQRLELARALARQPALLVLDEATSALDSETERRVDENLRQRGCSCLIIAHRLSTIRDCDAIIVLARGRVVQRGSHEQLLAEAGPYRELIENA